MPGEVGVEISLEVAAPEFFLHGVIIGNGEGVDQCCALLLQSLLAFGIAAPSTPGYFGVMRIPLLAGRSFAVSDGLQSTQVIVINQTLARRFWPGANPLGGRIVMLKVTPPNGVPYYLMDLTGNGNMTRRDSLDPGIRVPMWTIKSFD